MSKVEQNKALVGRWFTEFWGPKVNFSGVDELAAPDMLLQYSLQRGAAREFENRRAARNPKDQQAAVS